MCEECPDQVKDLARRLDAYFTTHGNVVTGGLHIVIEDENVQTEHIRWCLDTQDLDDESRQFAVDLLAMPLPYRHMAVQLGWSPRDMETP